MLYKQAKKLVALANKFAAKYDQFEGNLSANDFYFEFHHALQIIRIDMINDAGFLQRLGFSPKKLEVFSSLINMMNNICKTYKESYSGSKSAIDILSSQFEIIDKLNQIIKNEYPNIPKYSLKSLSNLIELYLKSRMMLDQYNPRTEITSPSL